MEKSVLFVDDEKQILKSINRIFIDSSYNIFLADSGKEALKILAENDIDMVVSDMKMPEMDGYELLKRVKRLYPSIIRIILSGYSDEEIIYRAIHSNTVKVYMFKPWKGDELKKTLDDIFKTQELLNSKKILDVVNSVDDLPTLPDTYIKLNQAIENDCDMEGIRQIIEDDQVVSTELLHIVNSAFYGLKTGSIKNAIISLGLTNIKNIVLAMKIFNGGEFADKDKEIMWQHSSLTNKLLIKLYKGILNKNINDNYSSAGLLHDIGKIIISTYYKEEYRRIVQLFKGQNEKSEYEIERDILGIGHNEIGAYLLNWWEIPLPIVEVALFHEKPSLAISLNKELVCMTHIADYYSWQYLEPDHYMVLDDVAFEYLGITKEECDSFIKNIIDEV